MLAGSEGRPKDAESRGCVEDTTDEVIAEAVDTLAE
jgi:hypothetical protein